MKTWIQKQLRKLLGIEEWPSAATEEFRIREHVAAVTKIVLKNNKIAENFEVRTVTMEYVKSEQFLNDIIKRIKEKQL